jgi:uncharacterized oxidoreductase
MQLSGNTILVTGGGSGIGRGLAEALQASGNHVIIAGRRKVLLEDTVKSNPGMKSLVLDIEDRSAIRGLVHRLASEFPALNVLINNAGIMRSEDLLDHQDDLSDAEATIATNLLGPMRLTGALLPLLRKHERSTIINVSSGLAFVPLAFTPTYCATKAALHSYTQSLRYQLKDTTTEVLEIIPPYVQTELMEFGAEDPRAMPLKAFIDETMELLRSEPTPHEICGQNVTARRQALLDGKFDELFYGLNDAMASRFLEPR